MAIGIKRVGWSGEVKGGMVCRGSDKLGDEVVNKLAMLGENWFGGKVRG